MAAIRDLRSSFSPGHYRFGELGAIALALLTLSLAFTAAYSGSRPIGFVAIACGGIAALVAAWAIPPERLVGAWGLVLLVYVAWPIATESYAFLHLAVEYLVLLALVGSIVLSAVLRGRISVPRLPMALFVFAGGFLAYGVVSFGWAVDRSQWAQYLVMWAVYLGVFFCLTAVVSRMREKALIASLAVNAWCIAAFGVIGVVRTQSEGLLHGGVINYWALFSPLVRFRISEDLTLLLGIPLNLYLYRETHRARYLGLLAVTILAILLSFSRTGAVGLVVLIMLLAIVLRGRHMKKLYAAGAIAVVVIVGLRVVGFPQAVEIVDRLSSTSLIQQIWFGRLNPDDPGGGRQLILQEGIRIFEQNPLLGTGVGNYMAHFDNSLPTTHTTPHNAYLEALAEYGLAGAALIFAFWTSLTVLLWRRALAATGAWRTLLLGMAGLNVALLVMGLAAEFFNLPYFWFFLGLAVGLAIRKSPNVDAIMRDDLTAPTFVYGP